MDDTTNSNIIEDDNEENEFAEDFVDDNDPAFEDDEDMDFDDDDDDFGDDDDDFGDGDDDDWGNLTYDPQAEVLYRQSSQMDDDNFTSKEKNTTPKKPPSVFWKCIQCSFLNPPSNMNCMACKQHKNPYNCLQYILSTSESTEENSNSDSSDINILNADQSMERTHLLIYGIIHENHPQFMIENESLILKDIHVLILLYIPNYVAFGIGINSSLFSFPF